MAMRRRRCWVYQLDVQEDGRVGLRGYVCNHQAENRGAVNALAKTSRGKRYVAKVPLCEP